MNEEAHELVVTHIFSLELLAVYLLAYVATCLALILFSVPLSVSHIWPGISVSSSLTTLVAPVLKPPNLVRQAPS